MNYLDKLQRKIEKYKKKYSESRKKIAIKLIWWNFVQLICFRIKNTKISKKNLNKISLHLTGGLGDILIGFNYACYLLDYLKKCNISIDIYVKNPDMVKALDGGTGFNIYSTEHQTSDKYLLKIFLCRFPQILENNIIYSKYCKNQKLLKLVQVYKDFYDTNKRFFDCLPFMDGMTNQYSLINGQKRIQQADIGEILNISCDFKYSPKVFHEKRILNNLGLQAYSYITINRGVDNTNSSVIESTKLWKMSNYNKLVSLIKSNYKNYKIVQLGASTNRCQLIEDVDINLVGETSIDALKVLLKNSMLHIDCEGGMVHLRKSLNGGVSVVIFGPTSSDFYGYSSNVNVFSKKCPFSCEWLNDTWNINCINSVSHHICMESISPNMVFQEIDKLLKVKEKMN